MNKDNHPLERHQVPGFTWRETYLNVFISASEIVYTFKAEPLNKAFIALNLRLRLPNSRKTH